VERRVILAILLMLIVAVLPSILFPPKKPVSRTAGRADSTAKPAPAAPESAAVAARPSAGPTARLSAAPAETVWVTSPLYRLGFSTRGGTLVSAELLAYRSFAPGDSGRPVQLVPRGERVLAATRTAGGDTTVLADWTLTPSATQTQVGADGATLTFSGGQGGARLALEYRFAPGEYRFTVRGRIEGFGTPGSTLLVGIGDG